MPLASVIIPAYQATAFIERAVRSVVAQSISDWEVVIASDDGLDYAALLADRGLRDLRVRCVFTGACASGPANARNTALSAANAPLVATLDADDRLAPQALERLLPRAQTHGVSYCSRHIIDHATGQALPSFDRALNAGLVSLEDVLTSQVHSYAGVVFDQTRVGARWPTTKVLWEDVHFFVRCFDYVDRIYHDATPLYLYYRREGSICNRPETGPEYLDATHTLMQRLDGGDRLEIQNDAARHCFRRFLTRRLEVEARFVAQLSSGQVRDYRDFVSRQKAMFYALC